MITNREAIEVTLNMLKSDDATERCFGAKTLGGIGRSKNGALKTRVLEALENAKTTDENGEVKRLALRSILEIQGQFDNTWEKYNPQEPVGNLRDQYYLKRG